MAVLIVDDDPVQRRLLEGMVQKFGYEVITAEGKAILNHDLEMGITGIYVHVDLLPRMRE